MSESASLEIGDLFQYLLQIVISGSGPNDKTNAGNSEFGAVGFERAFSPEHLFDSCLILQSSET